MEVSEAEASSFSEIISKTECGKDTFLVTEFGNSLRTGSVIGLVIRAERLGVPGRHTGSGRLLRLDSQRAENPKRNHGYRRKSFATRSALSSDFWRETLSEKDTS